MCIILILVIFTAYTLNLNLHLPSDPHRRAGLGCPFLMRISGGWRDWYLLLLLAVLIYFYFLFYFKFPVHLRCLFFDFVKG